MMLQRSARLSRVGFLILLLLLLQQTPSISALTTSFTVMFNYTGSEHTWTIPLGVTSINVKACGGQGGGTNGGLGGYISSVISVVPGAMMFIEVGGGVVNLSLIHI